ncbi:hypothetical protein L6452_42839 [Arctium lappa]|uniref:Uncharacterized protein n=1 Tax=Arctium lappa TaxID=4217 RepID=A0ACB8XL49_ARCLA|nr:hypothetical protein L6452_42839 [Arctium lappa]
MYYVYTRIGSFPDPLTRNYPLPPSRLLPISASTYHPQIINFPAIRPLFQHDFSELVRSTSVYICRVLD